MTLAGFTLRALGCVSESSTLCTPLVSGTGYSRTLLSARNRGITSLQMQCLANNQHMQQLARKFEAGLSFDFGSVVGEVDPAGSTPLSLMREAMADNYGIATAIFEAQSRLFKPA